MPATTARSAKARTPKAPTKKAPAKRAPASKAPASKAPAAKAASAPKTSRATTVKKAAGKTADLSQSVFTSVEAGQRTALAAVRTFVDTVDQTLPTLGAHPSRRETVIDAALDMADKLVTVQYGFLRNVVRSADRSLHRSGAKEK